MTVKKKIEGNDELRYEIISKGGSVSDDEEQDTQWQKITLRISDDMLKEIKKLLIRRPGLTRNAWILESIQDKIRGAYE